MAWRPVSRRPREPLPVTRGYTCPAGPPDELDHPEPAAGVPLYQFGGFEVNPARLNGSDINPNNPQTMRVAYDDGVQLFNGVDGITSKRFGPSQFYVLSDANPGQTQMVPHGKAPSQVLTASDIQRGPAGYAASVPAIVPGAVYNGGTLMNPGGC